MNTILEAYTEMPPVTRAYTTACVLTTLAVVRSLAFIMFERSLVLKSEDVFKHSLS